MDGQQEKSENLPPPSYETAAGHGSRPSNFPAQQSCPNQRDLNQQGYPMHQGYQPVTIQPIDGTQVCVLRFLQDYN